MLKKYITSTFETINVADLKIGKLTHIEMLQFDSASHLSRTANEAKSKMNVVSANHFQAESTRFNILLNSANDTIEINNIAYITI
ncbi:MAG: hypothetical protein QM751_12895 [Paludibacteraceae bacterium]